MAQPTSQRSSRHVFVCSAKWNREFVRLSCPADGPPPAAVVQLPHPSRDNAQECAAMVMRAIEEAGGLASSSEAIAAADGSTRRSEQGPLVVHSVSDDPMVVLGMMRETALTEGDTRMSELLQNFPLRPTLIAANKLLTRLTLHECGGVPFAGVSRAAADARVPQVSGTDGVVDKVILKPLAGVASMGLVVAAPGDAVPEDFAAGTEDDLVYQLCQEHFPGDVGDGGTGDAIGIAEQYMAPDTVKCYADGYVCANGRTEVLAIGRNVYAEDDPERLLYCQFPSNLPEDVEGAIAAKMHRVLAALHECGMYNQVVLVEFFALPGAAPDGGTRVEVMEVNGRAYANAMPVFEPSIGHSIYAVEERIRHVTPDTPLDAEDAYPKPTQQRCAITVWLDFLAPEGVYRDPSFPNAFVISTGAVTHAYGLDDTSVDDAVAQAYGMADLVKQRVVADR